MIALLAGATVGLATGAPASAGPMQPFNLAWGGFGATNGLFSSPRGVAYSPVNGNVYVSDTDNHRIQVFTPDGTFVRKWGRLGTTNGRFNGPRGIAIDAAGDVYVVDRGNNRIQRFTADGTFVTKWGTLGSADGQLRNPRGIAITNAGTVYVADTGNDRVQRFSSTGVFVSKWGTTGSGSGQFSTPSDLTLGISNIVYVADSGNNRIQRFNSTGVHTATWGTAGSGNGQLSSPRGIAYDAASNEVIVADSGNDRLQRFDSNGVFKDIVGSSGTGDGEFDAPEDLALDGMGNAFVADTVNHRVQRFGFVGPPPPFARAFGTRGAAPGQIETLAQLAVDADGNVYAADPGNQRVTKYAPDGVALLTLTGLPDVKGVAVDSTGAIYTVDPTGVTAFDAAGAEVTQWSAPNASAIAVSPVSGNLFVADTGADVVEAYSPTGTLLLQMGAAGPACGGNLTTIGGVAVDDGGMVYVSDATDDCVSVFSEAGAFVDAWGSGGPGAGTFAAPGQVTVDQDGNVTVVDAFTDLVQTFTPDGRLLAGWGTTGTGLTFGNLENPTGVVADTLGNIYVADRDNDRIQRFAVPGSLSGAVTGPGGPAQGIFVVAMQAGTFSLVQAEFTDGAGQYSLTVPPGRYALAFIDPTQTHTLEWFDDKAVINEVTPDDLVAVEAGGTATADATLAASGIPAPVSPATVNGTLTGPSGPLAGVFVLATDFNSGRARGATTNASGQYTISGLHPGNGYRVEFIDPTGATLPEWYDNRVSTDIDNAQVFSLFGATVTTLNATLADNPAF